MGSEEKPDFVTNANVIPFGDEQITGAGVLSLTLPTLNPDGSDGTGADKAVIQIDGEDVRYRDNGDDPTTVRGILLKITDPPFVYESDLSKIKFQEVAPGAVINVSYYRNKGSN